MSGHAPRELLNRGLIRDEELTSRTSRFLQKPFSASDLKDRIRQIMSA